MKKILTFLFVLVASVVMAQPAVEKVVGNKLSKMDAVLKLSEAQKKELVPLYTEQTKRAWAANELEKGSSEQKEAFKSNNLSFNQSLKKVLTPEQLTQWRAHLKSQAQKK